jgi:hypothetical protein
MRDEIGCPAGTSCNSHDDCLAGLRCSQVTRVCSTRCMDQVKDGTESSNDCGYSGITKSSIQSPSGVMDTRLVLDTPVMSLGIWLRLNSAATPERGIFSTAKASVSGWQIYRTTNGKLGFRIQAPTSGNVPVVGGLVINAVWTHCVVVIGGTPSEIAADASWAYRVRLYVNGVLQATSSRLLLTRVISSASLWVSAQYVGTTTGGWVGYMDQVAVWTNTALNYREVNGVYRMEPTRSNGPYGLPMFNVNVGPQIPTALWNFDTSNVTLERIYGVASYIVTTITLTTTFLSPADTECRNPCPLRASCVNHTDCGLGFSNDQSSTFIQSQCYQGICSIRSTQCTNQIQDGDEEGIDCGGSSCLSCYNSTCTTPNNCASAQCSYPDQRCTKFSCYDGLANGDEEGVDCGGSCPNICYHYRYPGQSCYNDTQCTSGYCVAGVCANGQCWNTVKDGDETGVDCGGSSCLSIITTHTILSLSLPEILCCCYTGGKCTGASCTTNFQCASYECDTTNGVCYAPASCYDGRMSSTISESDIDCGQGTYMSHLLSSFQTSNY